MYRIKEDYETELMIKKSRFITYLHTCLSQEEAKSYILAIRKLHPNANHVCYAMIIGDELKRSNDDGEPSGTAGLPMLECLAHRDMQDLVAITVRYFGGIKLGGGGLIRAYSKSVANALDLSPLCKQELMTKGLLSFSYELIGKIDYLFREKEVVVLEKTYESIVTYTFLCREFPSEELSNLTSGLYLPEFFEEENVYIDVEKGTLF